jgi:putative ABC transport system permease protein
MTLLHRLVSVLRWLLRRNRAEQALNDELQAFLEMAAADNMRDDAAPDEAHRLAVLQLGGVEQVKEQVRTGRHGGGLDAIGRDIRYAVRMASRNPGFTLVVVLTLALGIGANTAMFSLIDALMLRLLPVRDPQQLVLVEMVGSGHTAPHFPYAIVRTLADRDDVFATAGGFSGWRFTVGPPGSVRHVQGALVTGGYYETLGLNPAVGRLLTRGDDEPGAPLVAVISHGFWGREFANRPDVVGQTLTIGGAPVAVVGVSPRGFVGTNVGESADITMPVSALPRVYPEAAPLLERGNFWLRVLARPAVGVSVRESTARLNAVWRQIAEPLIAPHWPASRRKAMADTVFQLSPGGTGWTSLRDQYTKPLLILMGAVAVVLLIACANVASLLLARASARQREMAVRLAIGASRFRVMRQLLIESTLLSLTGAAVGLALAWFAGRFLIGLLSTGPVDVVFDLTPNAHVLGFTLAAAIATAIGFGTAPALQATAAAPSVALKADARMSGSPSRLLPSLVIGQIALSVVLLVGAGLFVRTLRNLQSVDPGFVSEGVLLVDLDARRTALPLELLNEVRRIPGVVSASISTHTPLSGSTWSEPAVPTGQPVPERDNALFVGAGPGFFDVMQIRLLAGRAFTDRDAANRSAVAIVTDVFARRHFPNQHPVGEHLSASVRGELKELEIVGVAANTHATTLRAAPHPTVYVPYAQLTRDFPSTLTIRAAGPLGQIGAAIRQALQRHVPNTPIEVRALSEQVNARMVQERMLATLASGFGFLALVLVSIGLYGLLAYGVARRIKEIGIRMALGAERRRVIALVLRSAARLVLTGIALGVPVALGASRWVESMLFGLKPTDLATIGSAVMLLVITAQVAAYVPAWRASRVDPLAALRHE